MNTNRTTWDEYLRPGPLWIEDTRIREIEKIQAVAQMLSDELDQVYFEQIGVLYERERTGCDFRVRSFAEVAAGVAG